MVDRGRSAGVLRRGRALLFLVSVVVAGLCLLRHDIGAPARISSPRLTTPSPASLMASLPVNFEPNLGQFSRAVTFLAHGSGYQVALTNQGATLAFPRGAHSITMRFAGANPGASIAGAGLLPGHANYFIGNDPSRWRRNIPQFSRVAYHDLYPGVDLAFYGKQGTLEYDFAVSPGADPRKIELQFTGADLQVAANGDLVLGVGDGELRFQAPHIYQRIDDRETQVAGGFVLLGNGRAGFQIDSYDRTRALIIDPVLAFSTYLGGSGGESCAAIAGAAFVPRCPAIAVDSAARIYIAGATTSPGSSFPGAGGTPPTLKGGADVFIARISNAGSGLAVDYVSYFGGSGTEYPVGIGVDSGFNVYVAGNTNSADLPTVNALRASASGNHAFATKFDPTGSVVLYSTYLGGSGTDSASGMALDSQAQVYVFGTTTSSDFPTTPGALQGTARATNQFFFTKLNPAQNGPNSLLYSTFIGGSNPANGAVTGGAVAVDSNLNVYLAGGTNFTDMPILNAYQGVSQGGTNVWAARLNAPTGNTQQYTPLYETYLGASGDSSQVDIAYGVASDGTNTFITGSTSSNAFTIPTGTVPLQASNGGGTDAFVAKFGVPVTTGTTQGTVPLNYFTYMGGSGTDVGLDITANSTDQNARVTGLTQSGGGFPNTNPLPGVSGGGTDAFFARLVTTLGTGSANTSATSILGGSGSDIGTSITTDLALNSYIGGETTSPNFPASASPGQPPVTPVQSALSGASDAFITKLGSSTVGLSLACPSNATTVCTPASPTASPSPIAVGNNVTFTFPIYNTSDPVNGVVFTDTVQGTNSTISSVTVGGTGSCSNTTTSAVCNLGVVNTSGSTVSGSTTTVSQSTFVTVVVTATAPNTTSPNPPKPPDIGNVATLTIPGTSFQSSAGQSASVNDFGIQASPNSQTVTAGNHATYTVVVTPSGPISQSVSLGQCSGLPSGANCTFSDNPIANLNSGAQSRTLEITTTPRVTTPASLFRNNRLFYAMWFPISGIALIGAGATRRRRWLAAVFVGMILCVSAVQMGCGSSTSGGTTTNGTPAGTYTVTLSATSGSATRSAAVTLVVQ